MTDLTNRVILVTGAGNGLGREHALLLAAHGARVGVNDLSQDAAQAVVDEITAKEGEAIALAASVTDMDQVEAMVARLTDTWGRIDGLVNNAGILRDKSFAKMDLADFRLVIEVHVMGAVHCCKAVWPVMQAQGFGRIVMTTSSSGLYGNFGQSNYGAAKMALVGLMRTLAIEGARYDIRVNSIAPTAATQMLEGLLPQEELDLLHPGRVSPGIVALMRDDAPNDLVLCAGAGAFATANVTLTKGAKIAEGAEAVQDVLNQWDAIVDRTDEYVPQSGAEQGRQELAHAGYARPAD